MATAIGNMHIAAVMDHIDAKRQRLRTLRLQVARYRRWVIVLLLLELLTATGLVLVRSAAQVPGSPPTVES